jgi:integrase
LTSHSINAKLDQKVIEMGIYKRNKIWYIDYYFEGKRIRERVGPRKKLAESILTIRQAEIAQGKFDIQLLKPSVTFKELSDLYIEYAKVNKKSWRRDVTSLNNILPVFGELSLRNITPLIIEEYKQKRRRKAAPATVNRELACMKHMFSLAITWKKAIKNPVISVKFFKEKNQRLRFLSEEEISKLVEACSPQLKPVVITAITTGMRLNEILSLQWKDIDLKRNLIILDETKGGSSRKIPINDGLKVILTEMQEKNTKDFVFKNSLGKPYRDVRTTFRTAIRKSKLKGVTFHTLRHTFASHLVMANINLRTVQELLGHKTIQMTMRYSHLSGEYKQQAVNILHRRIGIFDGHNIVTNSEKAEEQELEKPK